MILAPLSRASLASSTIFLALLMTSPTINCCCATAIFNPTIESAWLVDWLVDWLDD